MGHRNKKTKENPKSFLDSSTKETCEFIFGQAEKALESSINLTESLRNRALGISGLCSTILTGLITYVMSDLTKTYHNIPLYIIILGLIIASYYCTKILEARENIRLGNEPSHIIKEYDNNKCDLVKQSQSIKIREFHEYEARLKIRKEINEKLAKWFNNIVKTLKITFVAAILTAFLSYLSFFFWG